MRGVAAGIVVLLLGVSTAGCGGDGPDCRPAPARLEVEREVDVAYEGPVLEAAPFADVEEPMLVVELSSSVPRAERVWARVDGVPALDVDLPATPDDPQCRNDARVFAFGIARPAGPVTVEVGLSGGTVDRRVTVPDDGPVWVVVQPFGDPATSDISVFADPPGWD